MAESNHFPDDPERFANPGDDAEEAHQAALDRADRLADYTPAPDPVALPVDERAFAQAAARGAAIFDAADSPPALARAVGTTQTRLIRFAAELQVDAAETYRKQGLSPTALALCTVTDALLLGVLIGRELPR